MRKETEKIVGAFINGVAATASRTFTDGKAVFLHGNKIAKREANGDIWISFADWPTRTTSERINGVIRMHPNIDRNVAGVGVLGGRPVLRLLGNEKLWIGRTEWVNLTATGKMADLIPMKIGENHALQN